MSDQLFLFATVVDTAIAIPTDEIEAVVRLGEIVPIARTPAHVRGLAALRSRVLTVIDLRTRITGQSPRLDQAPLAIVADVEGHNYGLLVDDVSDICPVEGGTMPVYGRVNDEWSPYARGMLLHEGITHLVLAVPDLVRLQITAQAA